LGVGVKMVKKQIFIFNIKNKNNNGYYHNHHYNRHQSDG